MATMIRKQIAQRLADGPRWARSFPRLSRVVDSMVREGELFRVSPAKGAAANMIALSPIGRYRYGISKTISQPAITDGSELALLVKTDQVAELLSQGLSIKEITARLGYASTHSVNAQIQLIRRKLGWQAV